MAGFTLNSTSGSVAAKRSIYFSSCRLFCLPKSDQLERNFVK
jgi:hypothetical protein